MREGLMRVIPYTRPFGEAAFPNLVAEPARKRRSRRTGEDGDSPFAYSARRELEAEPRSSLHQWDDALHMPMDAYYDRFRKSAGPEATLRVNVKLTYADLPKNGHTLSSIDTQLFHNVPFDSKKNVLRFAIKNGICSLETADLFDDQMGKHIAKGYMRDIAATAREHGCKSITLSAGLSVGGYAWAKYGFYPKNQEQWMEACDFVDSQLKRDSGSQNYHVEFNGKPYPISKSEFDGVKAVIASSDPKAIWHLLEFTRVLDVQGDREITLAKALLMGSTWDGKLELDEQSQSWKRFMAYTERNLAQAQHAGASHGR
ncbi:MAG: hypothetical protein K2Q01_11755 [Rickettsiales bacterium]|nr:hypothetical protein [Rickettsiales bacterium]